MIDPEKYEELDNQIILLKSVSDEEKNAEGLPLFMDLR